MRASRLAADIPLHWAVMVPLDVIGSDVTSFRDLQKGPTGRFPQPRQHFHVDFQGWETNGAAHTHEATTVTRDRGC